MEPGLGNEKDANQEICKLNEEKKNLISHYHEWLVNLLIFSRTFI